MIINIDAPIKQKEIMEVLENDSKAYKHLGYKKNMRTCLQYEVDETTFPNNDPVSYTKNLIKSQEFGRTIMLRVLEDGKNW